MSGFNSLMALDKRPGLMCFLAAGWDAEQVSISCSRTDPLLNMIQACPRTRPPPSLSPSDLCSPFSSARGCKRSHIQIAQIWFSTAFWTQMSSEMSETRGPDCVAPSALCMLGPVLLSQLFTRTRSVSPVHVLPQPQRPAGTRRFWLRCRWVGQSRRWWPAVA